MTRSARPSPHCSDSKLPDVDLRLIGELAKFLNFDFAVTQQLFATLPIRAERREFLSRFGTENACRVNVRFERSSDESRQLSLRGFCPFLPGLLGSIRAAA